MPLIELHGLTKLYRMGGSVVHALDGVDLSIERGEFVAITGASGSGKSTMMHLLGCLDRPTGGRYVLDGRDVSDLSDSELAAVRNQRIGFVFQTFNLINRMTALDNVGVPLFYARQTNTRGPSRRALERVGLTARGHHNPNELSGGERQRVAIARAIVNDPPLVLADEPTGNLDSRTGEQIMEIFRQLNAMGVTIVVVTHEPDIARQAGRIVQMRDGQIVSDRRTEQTLVDEVRPVATAAPATLAPPAGDHTRAEATSAPTPALTPRLMRGTTLGFVFGLLAIVAWAGVVGSQVAMAAKFGPELQQWNPARRPPTALVVLGAVSSVGILGGLVFGICALLISSRARRRMRIEPGNWVGRKRALTGWILGLLAIVGPLLALVVSIIRKVAA